MICDRQFKDGNNNWMGQRVIIHDWGEPTCDGILVVIKTRARAQTNEMIKDPQRMPIHLKRDAQAPDVKSQATNWLAGPTTVWFGPLSNAGGDKRVSRMVVTLSCPLALLLLFYSGFFVCVSCTLAKQTTIIVRRCPLDRKFVKFVMAK